MGDFGHFASSIGGAHIDAWGAGPFLIRHGKRQWWFEDSDMFGPSLLRKAGLEIADRQPGDAHPFWGAYQNWRNSGRKHRAIRDKRGQVRFYLCHIDRRKEMLCLTGNPESN